LNKAEERIFPSNLAFLQELAGTSLEKTNKNQIMV